MKLKKIELMGLEVLKHAKEAEAYMRQLHTYYLQKYLGTKLHSRKFKPSRTSLNE